MSIIVFRYNKLIINKISEKLVGEDYKDFVFVVDLQLIII